MNRICPKCNRPMLDDEDRCIICGSEAVILTDEEMNELRKKWEKEAAEANMNKVFEDIRENRYRENHQNTPKCPTCGSTNIKPISSISMMATRMLFGPYSKKSWSQFQCNNCGYMW